MVGMRASAPSLSVYSHAAVKQALPKYHALQKLGTGEGKASSKTRDYTLAYSEVPRALE